MKLKYFVFVVGITILIITGLIFWNTFLKQPDIGNFNLKEADNWYLPEKMKVSEKGGFYDYWTENIRPKAESVELNWQQIEPEEGKYDWSVLKDRLAKAKQNGRKIWLRIYMLDKKLAPQWARTKYSDLPNLEYGQYQENTTGNSPGNFYPIWNPKIENEIKLMMADMAEQNIISDPDLAFMYVPFGWRWDEWEAKFIKELRQDNFTPTTFLKWFKSHLEIFTTTFKGYENKMMYTGIAYMNWADGDAEWIKGLNNLKTGNNLMTDIAVNLGMSVRVGDMEYFNNFSFLPSWGRGASLIDGYYYQNYDPNHPLIKDKSRLIGSENEAFGDDNMFPKTKDYYYPRMNTLKSLQLGVNWLNTQGKTYDLAPSVFEYSRKVLGKDVDNQPDAWASLRQWKDLSQERLRFLGKENLAFDPDIPFRNWEKLLYQREVKPNGQTTATNEVGNTKDSQFFFYNGTSFEALRTDKNSGNNYFYFQVDKKFLKPDTKYKLAITYLDNSSSTWQVEYFNNTQQSLDLKNTNSNSNQWKTALFDLSNITFNQGFNGGSDFRIYNGGQSDLTLTFVRLVRD